MIRAIILLLLFASPALAQVTKPNPPPSIMTGEVLTTVLEQDLLRDLPTADNLFAVLERTQASLVSDRFSGGGLYFGQAPKMGSYFGSPTQTHFRYGDVSIDDPNGSGGALLFPELPLWQRTHIVTGSMPANINTLGYAVLMEPLAPTDEWVRTLTGSFSHGGMTAEGPASYPPAIAALDSFDRVAGTATGPVIPGKVGGAFTASWARASQTFRNVPSEADAVYGSFSANLLFKRNDHEDVQLMTIVQGASYPNAYQLPFADPSAVTDDTTIHLQGAWERRNNPEHPMRLYGAWTFREHSSRFGDSIVPVVERLRDGPVSDLAFAGDASTNQWTLGLKSSTPRLTGLEYGAEIIGASTTNDRVFRGPVGETIDGAPARIWVFSTPEEKSSRGSNSISLWATDKFALTQKLSLDAGLRFETIGGSADGAAESIRWFDLLPRASLYWRMKDSGSIVAWASAGRSAYRLPLDLLAYSDPNAQVADVYRWDAVPGNPLDPAARGPLLARTGPGLGGDPMFVVMDENLNRPTMDELVLGMQFNVGKNLIVRVAGIARRERDLIGLVNVGAPASAYTPFTVFDQGVDITGSDDDGPLTVYNRRPETFGQDRYFLTNPEHDEDIAHAESFEISVQYTRDWFMVFTQGSANQGYGPAANRGFRPEENDEAIIGEVFTNPNATAFSRGSLFADRGFTGKMTGVFYLPKEFNAGFILRYQDGQPFSRLVIAQTNQGLEAVRAFESGKSLFHFTATIDLRLSKKFRIGKTQAEAIFDGYDLLGGDFEFEERVVTGADYRNTSALQPPRSVHFGFRVTF